MQNLEQERARFEAWAEEYGLDITPYSDDKEYYEAGDTGAAWSAWQARCSDGMADFGEIYVGRGQFAIFDWEDFDLVKGYWWRLSTNRGNTRYAQAHDCHDVKTRKRISMHGLIMSPPDGKIIDHINGNGLDNRKRNLRIATYQQNSMNSKSREGSSPYKGVSFDKESNKWRATITKNRKKISLGRFEMEVDAAHAYNLAAASIHGDFARLNYLAAAPQPGEES